MATIRSEFEGMEFDPTIRPQDLIWKVYPRLAKNKFFSQGLPEIVMQRFGYNSKKEPTGFSQEEANSYASTLLRFCILVLDEESPLASERDWGVRLREAAVILKISSKNNKLWDLVSTETEEVVACMQQYIAYIASYDYKNWVTLIKHHNAMCSFLLSPPTFGGKNAENDMAQRLLTEKNLEGTAERLQVLEAKLFPTPRLERKMKEKLLDDSFAGYVEHYANQYKEEDVI